MGNDGDPDRTRVSVVDPFSGKVLDRRYRIEFKLATGGFGSVYRARHVINGRDVAIKVLHASLAQDKSVAARFRREAAALGQLKNAHTVTAYDFGEASDGTLYIVMELLSGESLYEQYQAKGPMPWRRVAAIMVQVCSALSEAHAHGIVHRDLKPANIHLERRGDTADFVKVLDFGIAKIMQGSELGAEGLTHAGQVIGTFDYMAPEQLVGGEVSGRSDIFTLGVVMHEMISGEHPFGEAPTPAGMISAILSVPAPLLSTHAAVPHELDQIVAKCLQWEPDRRYRKIEQLAAALEHVLAADEDQSKTTIQRAPSFLPEDQTATWISPAPEPDRPTPTPEPDLYTTLPGVGPPKRKK
jgi:serine/threonine-protein kinase